MPTIHETPQGTADSAAVREQLLNAIARRLNVQAHVQGSDNAVRRDTRPFEAGMVSDGELRGHLLYNAVLRNTRHVGHRAPRGAPSGLLVQSTATIRMSYRLRDGDPDDQDTDYSLALMLKDRLSAVLVTAFDDTPMDASYVPDTLSADVLPMPAQFPYLLLVCSLDVTHVLEL